MCCHDARTVVTGGKLAIFQCDMCGAMLWWLPVMEDATAVAIDVTALEMWERRTADAVVRDWQRLEMLKATNPAAWRAEVQRVMQLQKRGERGHPNA